MSYLFIGASLGLSAGLSPGPLMTLVITTSLRDGFWQGLRVAVAPFLTDLPIILLSLLVLEHLPAWGLAALGIAGSGYVAYLGWETIRAARSASLEALREVERSPGNLSRQSLARGALVNLLNPHPYIFWATVGGPTLLAALDQGAAYAAAFLVGFYALLVGSKIGIAALIHSQSHQLSTTWYRRVLAALGILLIGLAAWLAWETLHLAVA
ncbi:MAG: LysE family translocator [Caldilineales bacterium]